ncbi:MAG: hypothetical protein U0S48_20700 [Solirubrobacteraceae bacterium]
MNLRRVSLLLFILTLALMLPFEYTITRILGVACLVGFVVTGLFAIATPAYLSEAEHEEPPAAD